MVLKRFLFDLSFKFSFKGPTLLKRKNHIWKYSNFIDENIPNFYIFKRSLKIKDYLELCNANSTMEMQPNTLMASFLFSKWIDHFITNIAKK